MDFASLIGIVSGLALIVSAIILGGSADVFVNVPGLMIVAGGTIAATFLTVSFKDVLKAFRAAYIVFSSDKTNAQKMIQTMLELSRISHRHGLVKLGDVKTSSNVLKRACNLLAEAASEQVIRNTLQNEIDSLIMRHHTVQDIFKKMAAYAPAFGMLGTLIGLIQMLSELDNPETIGPSMAVALLTTFYGSLLSTMVFLPIAGKLRARTLAEVANLEIIREGCIGILTNDHYMHVYEQLASYLPEAERKPVRIGGNKSASGGKAAPAGAEAKGKAK
ncbi:MotA/TolQ/ExbB proton channel family protein [Pontibacterium sp. N1Y112]|uniref:MotA/TolQ/ExbB proton channel family protein n=1 Tax=Pontibacterium sinense TaxID=2781979 RepID=A0A8J7FHJ7_9GAMM|nr:MotA/TolQ/ExbB proton channel family protein [Pontibacterium sinense]MBE9399471.1 MotA/TolQ/ExbB proton channel family protein [Pontibacterium sinense]